MCGVWPFFAFCSFNHAPIAPIELLLPFHVRTMCCRSPTIHCQYYLHLTQYTIAPCFCSVRTLLRACSAIVLACLQRAGCNISKNATTAAFVVAAGCCCLRLSLPVRRADTIAMCRCCTGTRLPADNVLRLSRVVAVRTSPRARPETVK